MVATAKTMELDEILKRAGLAAGDAAGLVIKGVTSDSRHVQPGFLFCAVAGVARDGAQFVSEAIEKGAVVIAGAEGLPVSPKAFYLPLQSPRKEANLMAAAFYGQPSKNLDLVGITGTNGKTSSALILETILSAAGRSCGLIGTVRNNTGKRLEVSRMTTPAGETLQKYLAEMCESGIDTAAIEVSSHALDQDRIAGTELAVAAFTRITRDHLDYHKTVTDYRLAKARILESLRPQGHVVLNADAEEFSWLQERLPPDLKSCVSYSLADPKADFFARIESMSLQGMDLTIAEADTATAMRSLIFGTHNAENILLAIASARALGLDMAAIKQGVEALRPSAGRLQSVNSVREFDVVVDYAHTPDAFERVLGTLRALAGGRFHVVFGCGGNRDEGKRSEMGAIAECLADQVVITDDNPRSENPEKIALDVRASMKDPEAVAYVPDRREAILSVLDKAEAGDLILLAGKGHEDYQIIGDQRFQHDDTEVVKEWAAWQDGRRGRAP